MTTDATGHQPECSDPADPLSRFSVISLFPRTLGILRDAPRPYDLDGDLDSLHDHLASAALRSPGQLLEQARAIVAKKSEILNDNDIGNRKRRPGSPSHLGDQRPWSSLKPDFSSQSAMNLLANSEFDFGKYDDPDKFFDAYEKFETTKRELEKLAGVVPVPNQSSLVDIGNRKRRRPGLPSHLRAQRPRFSLKPDFCSQSAMNLLANLKFDFGKYDDPDEFFDAYEKFETTKRELERLAGVVPVPNQSRLAGNRRPRRPGLSRGRVSYKHLFADITVSPQRTCQKDNLDTKSPLSALQPEGVESVKLLEHAVTGSTGAEIEASAPSDDVFSSIFEDLAVDGVDVVKVLQERLQIKSFDVESLQFPEMQDLQLNDVKTPGSDSSKPRRAYMQNILNRMHSKSPSKHGRVIGSLRSNVLSPTPPKSPLNLMNLLRKPLAEIISPIDPVSPDNLKSPVRGITQPTMCLETNSPNAKRGTYSGFSARSKLLVPEEVCDALRDSPQTESCVQNARHFSGADACDSYGGEESNVNIKSIQRNMVKNDSIANLADNENSGSCSKKEDGNAGLSEKSVYVGDSLNTQAAARGTVNSSNIEDCDVSVDLSQKDVGIESPMQSLSKEAGKPIKTPIADKSGHQGKDQEKEKTTLPKVRKGKQGRGRKQTMHSRRQTSAAVENLSVTEGTDTGKSRGNPVEHDEFVQVLPEELLADRKKEGARPRNVHLRKELNRRQSLAAAGTSWCGGVRRSTRIKSRPLEYWKGERFLYSRVHNSLVTVIGIKYASPGKPDNGKSSFKVKSFVSDQYKDLVDLAALH